MYCLVVLVTVSMGIFAVSAQAQNGNPLNLPQFLTPGDAAQDTLNPDVMDVGLGANIYADLM